MRAGARECGDCCPERKRRAALRGKFAAAWHKIPARAFSGHQLVMKEVTMADLSAVKANAEIIGADGVHVGTVDRVEGNRIKLTRPDSGLGTHKGHHHFISGGLVAEVEHGIVRLSANADVAITFEEEANGL